MDRSEIVSGTAGVLTESLPQLIASSDVVARGILRDASPESVSKESPLSPVVYMIELLDVSYKAAELKIASGDIVRVGSGLLVAEADGETVLLIPENLIQPVVGDEMILFLSATSDATSVQFHLVDPNSMGIVSKAERPTVSFSGASPWSKDLAGIGFVELEAQMAAGFLLVESGAVSGAVDPAAPVVVNG